MIESELSFVFQGPIALDTRSGANRTRHCISAVRRLFPGSEIVLSTWHGSDTSGIEADKVVLNEDPGGWLRDDGVRCNCNRQIVSTAAGLHAASGRYAAKIRTDTTLTNRNLLGMQLDAGPPNWRRFDARVVILEKFTRDPARSSLLHFVSDLFQFGFRSDLMKLWDVPLAVESDYVGWSSGLGPFMLAPFENHRTFMRHADEQYIWMSSLRKAGFAADLEYVSQCRWRDIVGAESLMFANFKVLTESELGVDLPERLRNWAYPETCFTSEQWRRLEGHYLNEGSAVRRLARRLEVWIGARASLARRTFKRCRPGYLMRHVVPDSHPVRARYRDVKSRFAGHIGRR